MWNILLFFLNSGCHLLLICRLSGLFALLSCIFRDIFCCFYSTRRLILSCIWCSRISFRSLRICSILILCFLITIFALLNIGRLLFRRLLLSAGCLSFSFIFTSGTLSSICDRWFLFNLLWRLFGVFRLVLGFSCIILGLIAWRLGGSIWIFGAVFFDIFFALLTVFTVKRLIKIVLYLFLHY